MDAPTLDSIRAKKGVLDEEDGCQTQNAKKTKQSCEWCIVGCCISKYPGQCISWSLCAKEGDKVMQNIPALLERWLKNDSNNFKVVYANDTVPEDVPGTLVNGSCENLKTATITHVSSDRPVCMVCVYKEGHSSKIAVVNMASAPSLDEEQAGRITRPSSPDSECFVVEY